jgi:negative regulator of sigma E activity
MKLHYLVAAVLIFASCSQSIDTSEQLLESMKSAHGDTYFENFTFTQKTINKFPDGTEREEIWYESLKVPGALSIRFDPVDSGRGILFVRDSMFAFHDGEIMMVHPMVHPLLLLGFDVYALPVETTKEKLSELNYDLTVMHESTWQDRPAYVVGALAGDDSSKQFWVDKERLVFVRSMEVNPSNGIVMEVQFNKYEKVDGVWVSPEVLFLRNGDVVTEEHYSDMKMNVEIDPNEFDPARWSDMVGDE